MEQKENIKEDLNSEQMKKSSSNYSSIAEPVDSNLEEGEQGTDKPNEKELIKGESEGNSQSSENYSGEIDEEKIDAKEFFKNKSVEEKDQGTTSSNSKSENVDSPQENEKVDETTKTAKKYHKGDSGSHVVELKEDLVQLGFARWKKPSLYYGSITAKVVREFQNYYNLNPSGIADQTTRDKIEKVLNPPYQKGDRGTPVTKLKEKLVELGYAKWSKPSQYYGNVTANVVREFQKDYNMPTDGVAGEKTLNKIEAAINGDLKYHKGDSGSHVVELKEDLVQLGFARWKKPSEYYGSITAKVVREFQNYYNLNPSGIADQTTRDKIEKVLNPPYQKGDRGTPVTKLKEKLVELGYAKWSKPSQYYGNVTASVVREFQKDYSMPTDGVAGEKTLNKIEAAINGDLKYHKGDSGSHVVELKEDLVQLGFARWKKPSEYYGSITAKVVREFQNYYNLNPSGIADQTTRDKIEKVLNPPYQKGDRGTPVTKLKEKLVELGYAKWSKPSQYYGNVTANVVREFQNYHGIFVTGVANSQTLKVLEKALKGETNRYKRGDSGSHVVELKEDLVKLGFARWSSPNEYYGSITTKVVKEFQNYYSLNVTGNADILTLSKIESILSGRYTLGDKGDHVLDLKQKLAILGYDNWTMLTNYYGSETVKAIKRFQSAYGLKVSGIADEVTLKALFKAEASVNYSKYNLSLDQAVDMQMELSIPPQTDQNYAYVSAAYINDDNQVTADVLNVRSGPSVANREVGTLAKGTVVAILGETNGWYQIEFRSGQWVNASRDDVRYYLNPNNFINDDKQKFQFLDLSRTSNATVSLVNRYLNGKGILEGQGQAFIDASDTHGVSDVYLLSHALLETGNGTSALANGVKVGKNSTGKLELVTSSNKDRLHNIKTTYNMFGIGAVDGNAHEGGAFRAYQEGWFTPREAIVGGASFIGNSYIKAGQNTLYKMRWNPKSMDELGYPSHQYATDVGWASKQIYTMYNLYQDLGIRNVYLDVPEYRN